MSAGLVDLGNQLLILPSIMPNAGVLATTVSGTCPASGESVGMICDMRDANYATNLIAAFGASISGQFKVQVQTSDDTVSGNFTDPTSGLQRMPTGFLSGGIAVFNSGNAQAASGGFAAMAFLRPHRYARARLLSGDQFSSVTLIGLAGAQKRTGSGPGYSQSPALGTSGFQGVGGF
jgi:hypothetical protein